MIEGKCIMTEGDGHHGECEASTVAGADTVDTFVEISLQNVSRSRDAQTEMSTILSFNIDDCSNLSEMFDQLRLGVQEVLLAYRKPVEKNS